MRSVLLTGATGLLGVELREQLESAGYDVTCVARNPRGRAGIIPWDLSSQPPPEALNRTWDVIVNCAADTRWSQTPQEAYRANVVSAMAVAALAQSQTHFVQVSTAAIIGPGSDGTSLRQTDYRNMYEWSKARAENALRQRVDLLTIVRPPLIIGRRSDGRAARFTGLYTLLRGITASTVPAVVAERDGLFDLVPVDDVALVVTDAMCRTPPPALLTPVCGPEAPRVGAVLECMCSTLNEWRAARGVPPVEVPPIIAPDSWHRFYRPFTDDLLTHRQKLTLDYLEHFLPYLKLTEPWIPDPPVAGSLDAIAPSVRYWADANLRLASLAPRAWTVSTG